METLNIKYDDGPIVLDVAGHGVMERGLVAAVKSDLAVRLMDQGPFVPADAAAETALENYRADKEAKAQSAEPSE